MEYQKIIDALRDLIIKHEGIIANNIAIVESYKMALTHLSAAPDNVDESNIKSKIAVEDIKPSFKDFKVVRPRTLENILEDYVNQLGRPLSAEVLREQYNKVKGANISVTTFSPRLVDLVKRKNKLVVFVNEGAPIKEKFLYGLPTMFSNISNEKSRNTLKPEYLEKIKADQGQLYKLL